MQRDMAANLPQWQAESGLIQDLPTDAANLLERLPEALEQVWPLSRAHRRQLPTDIRDLSAMLTNQRSELRFNYWKKPNWISAYLYYFLPWNLVRLCSLLPGLPLAAPGTSPSLFADAGSGPLTLPLALWLARPEWRDFPVRILAMDASRQPLDLGKALLQQVAKLADAVAWTAQTATGPLEDLASKRLPDCTPWLAGAANVLNELKKGTHETADSDRFERLLGAWRPLWQNGGQLLFIEPGTRLGGAMIMRMRQAALEQGLFPYAPCTHCEPCALPETEDQTRLPSGWCHFVFSAQCGPDWLKNLSREARLFKTSLSISVLLLANSQPDFATPENTMPVRVISQSFLAQMSVARYGCAANGLCLLRNSKNAVSGSLCLAARAEKYRRDAKSGAIIPEPRDSGFRRSSR